MDILYDIVTNVKLEKGLLSSTIRFKAPGLVSPIIVSGETLWITRGSEATIIFKFNPSDNGPDCIA